MNDLLDIINTVLRDIEKPEISELQDSFNLRSDLGFDSLALARLTVLVEDKFQIDIFSDGIIHTIGEVKAKIGLG